MASSSAGGKGSNRRPSQVPQEQVDENWDRIFKKKHKEGDCKNCTNCQCGKKTKQV